MARKPRIHFPGALYHVITRGNRGQGVFLDEKDLETFLAYLSDYKNRYAFHLYAYALMKNHLHLLIEVEEIPLNRIMQCLLFRYTRYFNRRYGEVGHLFQGRYKAIVCDKDAYLLELVRYIHLNPLRVGMVGDVEELNNYRWTGHSVIMGRVERKWQDVDTILGYFGRGREAVEKYEQFVREGVSQGRRPELVGGGLIRSLGGWSQVLSLRRKGVKVASDERILGSEEFIEKGGLLFVDVFDLHLYPPPVPAEESEEGYARLEAVMKKL
jgi:REP element-mobilizing transposase RayT